MKLMNQRNLLLACAVGVLAFLTPKLISADAAKTDGGSCCGGGGELTLTVSDTNHADAVQLKGKPDLLKTCPVSGEKLGEMGDPYKFVYKSQEVKLCCSGCKKDFMKNPDKFIAKIRAADPTNSPAVKN